jgi:hypothetical protein
MTEIDKIEPGLDRSQLREETSRLLSLADASPTVIGDSPTPDQLNQKIADSRKTSGIDSITFPPGFKISPEGTWQGVVLTPISSQELHGSFHGYSVYKLETSDSLTPNEWVLIPRLDQGMRMLQYNQEILGLEYVRTLQRQTMGAEYYTVPRSFVFRPLNGGSYKAEIAGSSHPQEFKTAIVIRDVPQRYSDVLDQAFQKANQSSPEYRVEGLRAEGLPDFNAAPLLMKDVARRLSLYYSSMWHLANDYDYFPVNRRADDIRGGVYTSGQSFLTATHFEHNPNSSSGEVMEETERIMTQLLTGKEATHQPDFPVALKFLDIYQKFKKNAIIGANWYQEMLFVFGLLVLHQARLAINQPNSPTTNMSLRTSIEEITSGKLLSRVSDQVIQTVATHAEELRKLFLDGQANQVPASVSGPTKPIEVQATEDQPPVQLRPEEEEGHEPVPIETSDQILDEAPAPALEPEQNDEPTEAQQVSVTPEPESELLNSVEDVVEVEKSIAFSPEEIAASQLVRMLEVALRNKLRGEPLTKTNILKIRKFDLDVIFITVLALPNEDVASLEGMDEKSRTVVTWLIERLIEVVVKPPTTDSQQIVSAIEAKYRYEVGGTKTKLLRLVTEYLRPVQSTEEPETESAPQVPPEVESTSQPTTVPPEELPDEQEPQEPVEQFSQTRNPNLENIIDLTLRTGDQSPASNALNTAWIIGRMLEGEVWNVIRRREGKPLVLQDINDQWQATLTKYIRKHEGDKELGHILPEKEYHSELYEQVKRALGITP